MRRVISRRILIPISVQGDRHGQDASIQCGGLRGDRYRKKTPAGTTRQNVGCGRITHGQVVRWASEDDTGWKCTAGWIGAAHAPGIRGRTRGRSKLWLGEGLTQQSERSYAANTSAKVKPMRRRLRRQSAKPPTARSETLRTKPSRSATDTRGRYKP